MDLSATILSIFAIDPSADAIEFEGNWLSFGDLATRRAAVETVLAELDLPEGARIGVLLRNHGDLVPVLLALFSSDRCLATFNAASPDEKLAEDIRTAGVPVFLATAGDAARDQVREAVRLAGASLVIVDGGRFDLAEHRREWDAARAATPDIAIEMLSSGTTGKPKRIPLPRRNWEKALEGAASYEKGRETDTGPRLRAGVQIQTAPLAHIAGLLGLMNNFLAGRKICLIDRFTVEGFRDAIVRHRPKVASAPPAALRMIYDADIPREDFASLAAFRTGTAPLDPDLADALYERYAIPVLQNYGATEFAGGVAGWTIGDFRELWQTKRGSVGRLNKGVEARAVDPDTGAPLAAGEEGLLELRAPNAADGKSWVRTTDLAVIDADGFLFLRGRYDGAIIRGGFKISPEDVALAMQAHPAVREAAVVGIKDRRLGEVPVAAWIARRGAEPVEGAVLQDWLKGRLLPYQVPARIIQISELPRTPSLKVDQPALRALLEDAESAG